MTPPSDDRDRLLGTFDRALEDADLDLALDTAREISPPLDLGRALRLTVALSRRPHPEYEAAARRFLARFAAEEGGVTTLRNVAQVADALAVLSIASEASAEEKHQAERGMLRLADQLGP